MSILKYVLKNIKQREDASIEEIIRDYDADMDVNDLNQSIIDAIINGKISLVKDALKLIKGIDVNKQNNIGQSILTVAFENDEYELLELILNLGGDINTRINYTHQIYTMKAALEFLPRYKLDPKDFKYSQGFTMLSIAAIDNNEKMVELLIKHKADPEIKDKYNKSAIDYTEDSAIKVIITSNVLGKQMDYIKEKSSAKAFAEALSEYDLVRIKKLSNQENVNVYDSQGKTVLMHAVCLNNAISSIRYLLRNGAKINDQDNKGMTALMHAIDCHDKEVYENYGAIRYLLSKKADILIKDNNGRKAIDYAKNDKKIENILNANSKKEHKHSHKHKEKHSHRDRIKHEENQQMIVPA